MRDKPAGFTKPLTASCVPHKSRVPGGRLGPIEPLQGDDPAVVYRADQFAERAALWAYGQRFRDFRRADMK